MRARQPIILTCMLSALGACAKPPAPPPAARQTQPAPPTRPARREVTFVDQVWKVRRSSAVEPGTLYLFMSEGTLIIASPHSKRMVGTWTRSGPDLTMVEESIPYRVEILRLTADAFNIRSHNPGTPVDIEMTPAVPGEP